MGRNILNIGATKAPLCGKRFVHEYCNLRDVGCKSDAALGPSDTQRTPNGEGNRGLARCLLESGEKRFPREGGPDAVNLVSY